MEVFLKSQFLPSLCITTSFWLQALKDSTQAIKLAKDSDCTSAAHLLSKAYSLRSQINAQLEDSKASLDDAREARHWVSDQISVEK